MIINPKLYDEDYFENGIQTGKSGYQNYGWLPELTIKMAHHLIQNLPINSNQRVLDFGCAKGFLVKALRLLDIETYGVDVSEYAISRVDPAVREYCFHINNIKEALSKNYNYDWLVSKDVFEHMNEAELQDLLIQSKKSVKNIFAAIPLGLNNRSGYIIPEYDRDITHITKEPLQWWEDLFISNGWSIKSFSYRFKGVKDSWSSAWPNGNGFFILSNK
jgi:hypothetical protein